MSLPNLRFYTTAGLTISSFDLGALAAGGESSVLQVILWNNKNGTTAVDGASNVRITVLDGQNTQDSNFITEGWVSARSSGTTYSSALVGFFDDQQTVYTPITGRQSVDVGDIPDGGGRNIFLKINAPITAQTLTGMTVQILAGAGSNVEPLPIFFNRTFVRIK